MLLYYFNFHKIDIENILLKDITDKEHPFWDVDFDKDNFSVLKKRRAEEELSHLKVTE
jgi:hypothetical protein